jgi:hypothetical protein
MKTLRATHHLLRLIAGALLMLGLLYSSMVQAQTKRISDQQREALLVEVREGLLEHKQEFGGTLDLIKMKPEVMEFVWEFHYEDMVATKEEILDFQKEFDALVAQRGLTDAQKEAALMDLFNKMVDRINSSPLQCLKEGQSCNSWVCCEGLVCSDVPGRMLPTPRPRCANVDQPCSQNNECCSGLCEENLLTKKKSCQAQKKCYRPVGIHKSCNENPVCGEGSCEQYNANTLGIGECSSVGEVCKKDGECCSGSCKGGKCETNYICTDCVRQGQVPARGRKCCEGLMPHRKSGRCVIDLPPFMGVQNDSRDQGWTRQFMEMVMDFVFPQAHAQARIIEGESETVFRNEQNLVEGEKSVDDVRRMLESGEINEYDLMREGGVLRDNQDAHARDQFEADRQASMINRSGGHNFSLRSGTNFETCSIDLRTDFVGEAARTAVGSNNSLFDLQLTLLAFEYVALGAGVQDLWKVKDGNNIHTSLNNLASRNREERRTVLADVIERNERRMKCLCLDTHGYNKISDEQKSYFRENCPEQYAVVEELQRQADELGQQVAQIEDASGIKYKELMVAWYAARKDFEEEMLIMTTNLAGEMRAIASWATENDWFQVETRKYPLFRFTIKNYTGQVMFGTALATALVSAGVIALTGGFAATATLSAWAAAGIISASAASGALGVWFIGSLKGAWEAQAPLVHDEYVRGRENYKCGKKDRCSDFSRVLNQPYNKVCNKHISANACIRSFLVTQNARGETRYLIDPWVPKGISTPLVIRDNREYASLLDQSFVQARRYLSGNTPAEIAEVREDMHCEMKMVTQANGSQVEQEVCETVTVTNVIHPSGFRPPSYLQQTFVDEVAVSQFLPRLRADENTYKITDAMRRAIIDGAKSYIVDEGFFLASETDNLDKFASYMWEYHYIFPRISKADAISYPTPGLVTYLNLVANALDQTADQTLDSLGNTNNIYTMALQDLNITRQGLTRGTRLGVTTGDDLGGTRTTIDPRDGSIQGTGFGDQNFGDGRFFQGANTGLAAGEAGIDNLNAGDLAGRAQKVQAAIADRARVNEEKLKDLEHWKKHTGDSERGKRILAAQAELKRAFLSPSAFGSASGPGGFDSLGADGLAGGALNNANAAGQGALGGANRSNEALTTALPSRSDRNLLQNTGNLGANNRNPVSGVSGFNAADADRMREAIAARDRMGNDAFQTQDGQSIWEMVTNTYIRMYDRLLPRRAELRDLED